MSKIFVISDTHFNHAMLTRTKKRDFKTVSAMNEKIISNWNKAVKSDDVIYHLGDVVMNKKTHYFDEILPRLNGKIIFIKGNHDNQRMSHIRAVRIKHKGKTLELLHNPSEATFSTDYIIHGHVHKQSGKISIYKNIRCYNCIVELNNYKPKLVSEVIGELGNDETDYKEFMESDL